LTEGGNNLGGGALAPRRSPRTQTSSVAQGDVAVPSRTMRAPRQASSSTPREHPAAVGSRTIEPLYERLPRGPHRLDRGEVEENQRRRMYGAMIEAVATNGYGRTSVKQVVTLAGVSRRAFYEQFANKQE